MSTTLDKAIAEAGNRLAKGHIVTVSGTDADKVADYFRGPGMRVYPDLQPGAWRIEAERE